MEFLPEFDLFVAILSLEITIEGRDERPVNVVCLETNKCPGIREGSRR